MAEPYVREVLGPRFGAQPMNTGIGLGDLVAWNGTNNRWEQADAGSATANYAIPKYVVVGIAPVGYAAGDSVGTLATGCIVEDTDAPFTRDTAYYLRDVTNAGTAVSTTTLQAARPTAANAYTVIVGRALSTSRILIMVPTALNEIQGTIHAEAGTAGLPAFTFSADPDTGMYRIGANDMAFATAGVVALEIGASGQLVYTPSALSGTPSLTTGGYANAATATFTDNATAMSGTATGFAAYNIVAPTLAATNTSVTTTDVATLRVSAAPTAGTNETFTRSYSLLLSGGQFRVDSNVQVNNTATFATTQPTATAVFQSGTAPAGAITTGGGVFTDGTNMRKIIAAGTVSNIET